MLFRSTSIDPRVPSRASLVALLLVVALLSSPSAADEPGTHRAPWEREPPPEPDYPEITVTVDWLASRLDARDVVVVDARCPDAYLTGHIPGALPAPEVAVLDLNALTDVLGGMGLTGRERIVCCGSDSRSGPAARLFWLFELAGARSVLLLDGGVEVWVASGGELVGDASERPAARWSPAPNPAVLATREYVRRSFGVEDHEVVDVRGREPWEGPVERADWGTTKRIGHIPHALPLNWWEFFEADGSMRSLSDSWFTFAALGPRPANPVDVTWEFIVYGDGVTGNGALGYFLLRRAGVSRVRYYPGGWKDWAGDPFLPVVRVVTAEELQWRLQKARRWFRPAAPPESFAFFDVRHSADYARGHIRGSVSLRSDFFADSLDIKLERYWPTLDRAVAPVVMYCYGERCIRSRATSTAAARAGFVYAERFYGGLDEWYSIGGGVVRP